MLHQGLNAERLAKAWHVFGVIASLFWALAASGGAIMLEPLTHAPGFLGAIFFYHYMAAVTNALIAGAGVIWHLWAAREHDLEIRRMEGANEQEHSDRANP